MKARGWPLPDTGPNALDANVDSGSIAGLFEGGDAGGKIVDIETEDLCDLWHVEARTLLLVDRRFQGRCIAALFSASGSQA